jgi:hypothetical protein
VLDIITLRNKNSLTIRFIYVKKEFSHRRQPTGTEKRVREKIDKTSIFIKTLTFFQAEQTLGFFYF